MYDQSLKVPSLLRLVKPVGLMNGLRRAHHAGFYGSRFIFVHLPRANVLLDFMISAHLFLRILRAYLSLFDGCIVVVEKKKEECKVASPTLLNERQAYDASQILS